MPSQHASHVPSVYAYTSSSQPSTSHAPANTTSYDSAPLSDNPSVNTINTTRSGPSSLSLSFDPNSMSGFPSRSMPLQTNSSNSTSYGQHFQHYDQLALAGNYGSHSSFDQSIAHHHGHIGQSALSFPQSDATRPDVSHELQNNFLNDSMPPSGTAMPSSSEHIDPMTTRTLMRTSPPRTTIIKRTRQDSFPQAESAKRTRTSTDGVRPPVTSSVPYPEDAWEMSGFSMSSQHGRALSRPTSELSGVNSPFHPDNRGPSNLHSGPVQRFLASPASDRPHSANSQSRSPEIHTMNGIAHVPISSSSTSTSLRPFASPQRRFSSASSHTFLPPTSISDAPNSQSPTIPGHPTPDGISPYYTPPSSGLRPSTGTASGSSFASISTLNALPGPDALATAGSDDGSSSLSHSMGEAEMIASFPQFYERVRALCLKFNTDAANLLRATRQDILAQSFQMGTGADPMRMLNDAKAICERMMFPDSSARPRVPSSSHLESTMLHGFSSAYSTSAYPPPLQGPWSPRLPSTSHHPVIPSGVDEGDYFAHIQLPKGVYGSDPIIQREASLVHPPTSGVDVSFNNSTLRSAANVNHGTWRDEESEKLRQLAEHSRKASKMSGQDKVDWDWVVERFGASRTRHQILIKATHLGLKPTSTHPSRIRKRQAKAEAQQAAAAAAVVSAPGDAIPGSSIHPTMESRNPLHSETMTSPAGSRHYPPHVMNQSMDSRPKSGETLQTSASNSDNLSPYEPGGSA
ncbi:hypothetical protein RSOL_225950 [Rhizoctonia solani AG-3 Rhs1AP]|uniref:Uncharacterized protein n=1 Tax=Rhizoctonia solani AG-3 Rhs1AP TaxID=1086054 RepID=X8J7R3_9AGAM|nr:hypothetical protein RSOL_225950 [Rhizoctonia solani AG-3 Rhs1AP]